MTHWLGGGLPVAILSTSISLRGSLCWPHHELVRLSEPMTSYVEMQRPEDLQADMSLARAYE
jgi:hypothetical protein